MRAQDRDGVPEAGLNIDAKCIAAQRTEFEAVIRALLSNTADAGEGDRRLRKGRREAAWAAEARLA